MAILVPRQIPTIDGDPTYVELSLRWLDTFGDLRADASVVDAKVTNAQIEQLVAKTVVGSFASLYTVRITHVYAGEKSRDNADSDVRASVQNNLVYHVKDASHQSRRAYMPAPKHIMFHEGTEMPDLTSTRVTDWMDAWDAAWGGGFARTSLRLSQRREIGKKKDL